MFYTGTPLFPFGAKTIFAPCSVQNGNLPRLGNHAGKLDRGVCAGFGLSYTSFSLAFADALLDDSAEIVLPIDELDTALANTSFAVKVTNTGELSILID